MCHSRSRFPGSEIITSFRPCTLQVVTSIIRENGSVRGHTAVVGGPEVPQQLGGLFCFEVSLGIVPCTGVRVPDPSVVLIDVAAAESVHNACRADAWQSVQP